MHAKWVCRLALFARACINRTHSCCAPQTARGTLQLSVHQRDKQHTWGHRVQALVCMMAECRYRLWGITVAPRMPIAM